MIAPEQAEHRLICAAVRVEDSTEMGSGSEITAKTALALARREGASHARALAGQVLDKQAQEGLREYALELEAEADALEAEIAALKEADRDGGGAANVVPIKPQER